MVHQSQMISITPGGDVSQLMGIEIRGSTSARDFEKKSFALETRNKEGKDEPVNLFGESPNIESKNLVLLLMNGALDM